MLCATPPGAGKFSSKQNQLSANARREACGSRSKILAPASLPKTCPSSSTDSGAATNHEVNELIAGWVWQSPNNSSTPTAGPSMCKAEWVQEQLLSSNCPIQCSSSYKTCNTPKQTQ